jgi:hypothetical protein
MHMLTVVEIEAPPVIAESNAPALKGLSGDPGFTVVRQLGLLGDAPASYQIAELPE